MGHTPRIADPNLQEWATVPQASPGSAEVPRAVQGLWVGSLPVLPVKRRGDKGTVQGKEGEVTFLKHVLCARHQAEHIHAHQLIKSSQHP